MEDRYSYISEEDLNKRKTIKESELPLFLKFKKSIDDDELDRLTSELKRDIRNDYYTTMGSNRFLQPGEFETCFCDVVKILQCMAQEQESLANWTSGVPLHNLNIGVILGVFTVCCTNNELLHTVINGRAEDICGKNSPLVKMLPKLGFLKSFSYLSESYCIKLRDNAHKFIGENFLNFKREDFNLHRKIIKCFDELAFASYETDDESIDLSSCLALSQDDISASNIFNKLNKGVYGQDEALREISVMAMTHLNRLRNCKSQFKKENYMLLGPTGSGKTEITRVLENAVPVPVVTLDMAEATPRGWKGGNIDDMLINALHPYKDHSFRDYSIVVLDEFDKLIGKCHTGSDEEYGRAAQNDLLKIMEGAVVEPSSDCAHSETLNTKNLLFIFAGAFEQAFKTDVVIGEERDKYFSRKTTLTDTYIRKCLVDYGITSELMGRIGNFTFINKLNPKDYVAIMKNIEGSMLDTIKKQCETMDWIFTYTDAALLEAAKEADKQKLGVRGMEHIINKSISKQLYDASCGKNKRIRLTKDCVTGVLS